MKSAFLLSRGLLCLYDKQNNTWLLVDIELNTRREIPYLRAPMYHSLFFVHFSEMEFCVFVLREILAVPKFVVARRHLNVSQNYDVIRPC